MLAVGFSSFAQQQGQYSQYMLNYYLLNPGVAGTEDFLDIRTGFRNQWTGLSGAPKNFYVSGHAPLNKIHDRHDKKFHNKIGEAYHVLGGYVNGQTLGALTTYNIYATYAYHLPLTKKWTLSMGASGGIIQYRLNPDKVDFGDNIPDNSLSGFNKIKPDLGIGVWLYSEKIFGGASTMQIFDLRVGDNGNLARHYYVTGGAKVNVNKEFKWIPSVMLRTNPTGGSYQVDINNKIKYMNLFWVGASYRHKDAVVALAGVNINDMVEIGYSYDATTSKLRTYSSGTHELMLALKLNTQADIHSPSDFW